jgi:hypothetical protein
MMMVDIDAHELAKPSRTTQLSEVRDKADGVACESDYCAVHVDYECVGTVYFGSRGQADVCDA